MCGNACYWRDEARFLRIELDQESREREETETYVGMLESQKYESDMRLQDAENRLANAHEEIEKLRFELETSYEGYVALDDLYMQRIAEDEDEDCPGLSEFLDQLERLDDEKLAAAAQWQTPQYPDEAETDERLARELEAEALLSEARFRELADNAEAEAAEVRYRPGGLTERPEKDLYELTGYVEIPPLPDVHVDATDGDQEVFYSGDWFVFSEYERDRLERALAEKLADVAELTAIRNKMTGK